MTYSSICPLLSGMFASSSVHLHMYPIDDIKEIFNNSNPLIFFTGVIAIRISL